MTDILGDTFRSMVEAAVRDMAKVEGDTVTKEQVLDMIEPLRYRIAELESRLRKKEGRQAAVRPLDPAGYGVTPACSRRKWEASEARHLVDEYSFMMKNIAAWHSRTPGAIRVKLNEVTGGTFPVPKCESELYRRMKR
jgi:hypothetical protein